MESTVFGRAAFDRMRLGNYTFLLWVITRPMRELTLRSLLREQSFQPSCRTSPSTVQALRQAGVNPLPLPDPATPRKSLQDSPQPQ
jgi:hypothetical protein